MDLTQKDIEQGYWYYRPEEQFPPKSITFPNEYDGNQRLNVICTQTDLPASRQRKLVKEWCQIFPRLENVQILWLNSKVNQELFEAVCKMKNLIGLNIKWSAIKRIDSLQRLKGLRYLNLGGSSQVESIDCLVDMKDLVWLEIDNFKKITDISPLSKLFRLRGLSLEGSMWTTQIVDSLTPLGQLTNLEFLSIANLKAKDKTLMP
jgi:Leucine-rich repeat (LRR) protein